MEMLEGSILTIITAATPLLIAALGDLVTERSGVLNLGVEGMMLVGAIVGFATTVHTGSAVLGCVAAALAGFDHLLVAQTAPETKSVVLVHGLFAACPSTSRSLAEA